ncbi:MAG: COX15/CtaA family protein [Planctomycetes bacterium]|nr:COX15/CtaA family protein [Planctomycetota bacterium]
MDQTSLARSSGAPSSPASRPWLQLFAALGALYTLVVIAAGGVVTTIGAGLSVPDWPTSYGTWLGPEGWYQISSVRAEHGHRLLAAGLGACIVALAIWVHVIGERAWVRHLAKALFVGVCVQGLLGGLTVLNLMPLMISATHGCLAQAILCGVATIAVGLTKTWARNAPPRREVEGGGGTRALASILFTLVFAQLVLGALMRHMKDPLEPVNPLAIEDFPLMFGGLLPPLEETPVVVHFLHRLGALLILLLAIALFLRVRKCHAAAAALVRPVQALLALVLAQVSLGAAVIWTAKDTIPTVAHVATGAAVLATAWVAVLFAWRVTSPARARAAAAAPLAASEARA